ncbi:5-formyltetrahydrofolate cyclo-ligase [Actinoplanes flavus]|uniref:5-formyltetrahydrofolate cyclo-ligase n=1 Tax=Actinoplanes flavus TaxID=2820290 RepID=UPI003FD8D8F4
MSDLTGDAEKSRQIKIALRARLLTVRRSLSDIALASAAAKLHDQTLALVRAAHPITIAAYVPIGSEPGGPDLPYRLAEALPAGGRLLLPVLLPDNDLDWAAFTGDLTPAPRGLREPTGPRLGPAGLRHADLILVPALAVALDGTRMGRGGGSYDRALSRLDAPGHGPHTQAPPHLNAPGHSPHDQAPGSHNAPASSPHDQIPGFHNAPGSPHDQIPGSDNAPGRGPHDQVPAHADGPGDPSRAHHGGVATPHSSDRIRPSGPRIVALLHDGEDVDTVPAEPHDRRVHAVITPTGGLSLRPTANHRV